MKRLLLAVAALSILASSIPAKAACYCHPVVSSTGRTVTVCDCN